MSKITITVSGQVGIGKSTLCAKLEILLKHLGCQVEWVGGGEENNLMLEDWSDMHQTPIEIVERVERTEKVYETYSGQNGWLKVSQDEYDRSEGVYERRIRRVPVQNVFDMKDMPRTSLKAVQAIASASTRIDGPCIASDGCQTERAVLQRFWRAHAGHPPKLIDQAEIDELVNIHSEWTPQGFAMVDSHREKFAKDLLALMRASVLKRTPATSQEPAGFMMVHRRGPDRGFSWVEHDPQFSSDWVRIPMFTDEQVGALLDKANVEYNERARKWRDAFDAMHKRAMKAEGKLAEGEAVAGRLQKAIQPQAGGMTQAEAMREVAQDIAKLSPEEVRAEHAAHYVEACPREEARELLPCPFCGGNATMLERHTDDGHPFYVSCDDCGIEVAYSATSELSKAKWNTRVEKDRVLEHVAVAEDGGQLRWMTGRRPRDCELYTIVKD